MILDRRRFLAGAGLAALAAGLGLPFAAEPAFAQAADTAKLMAAAASPLPEKALGSPTAPVTVVEYASMTCSHCAHFHKETFPELKKKYIDTGKVRFIFREFPFDEVATAAFMLARCMPDDKYYPMVSVLFDRQLSYIKTSASDPADKPFQGLLAIARQAGMSQADFEKCLSDKDLAKKVQESAMYGNSQLGVNSTPTFFINGKKESGAMPIDWWDKQLEPLLAGK